MLLWKTSLIMSDCLILQETFKSVLAQRRSRLMENLVSALLSVSINFPCHIESINSFECTACPSGLTDNLSACLSVGTMHVQLRHYYGHSNVGGGVN